MKRTLSVILLLCFLTLGLCSCREKAPEYKTKSRIISFIYFNTESTISSYGDTTDAQLDGYVREAEELLGYYHELFDIYFEYAGVNNLRTVNKNAGKAPVKVDAELIEFLEECKELFTLTNGKTNVMMGAVLKIWHNHREIAIDDPASATLPDTDKLTAAAEHTDISSLVIDKEAGTVYITDPEASIDVGAIGKGYATEKLFERLKEMGADSIALNIGGNLRTIGVRPDGSNWRSGITNPDRTSSYFAARIAFGETSCVTSGNYERFFTVDGVRYHHIIDPDTLMPARYFSSVTVITPDSALADSLSTALFCLSYEDGLSLVSSVKASGAAGSLEVVWITPEGNILSTDKVEFINS